MPTYNVVLNVSGSSASTSPTTDVPENLVTIELVNFSFSDAGTLTLLTLEAGDYLDEIEVDMDTVFNGTSPPAYAEIGMASQLDFFAGRSLLALGYGGSRQSDTNFQAVSSTPILMTIVGGGSTQGQGTVALKIRRAS